MKTSLRRAEAGRHLLGVAPKSGELRPEHGLDCSQPRFEALDGLFLPQLLGNFDGTVERLFRVAVACGSLGRGGGVIWL